MEKKKKPCTGSSLYSEKSGRLEDDTLVYSEYQTDKSENLLIKCSSSLQLTYKHSLKKEDKPKKRPNILLQGKDYPVSSYRLVNRVTDCNINYLVGQYKSKFNRDLMLISLVDHLI